MNNDKLQINDGFRLMKPGEVAEALYVSKSYVYKLVRTHSLPFIHIGKSVRIKADDLAIFIEDSRVDKTGNQ